MGFAADAIGKSRVIVLSLILANGQQSKRSSNKSLSRIAQRLFLIQQDGKWGYINQDGRIVISPQFYYAGSFYNGLAFAGRKYESSNSADYVDGYINSSGKFIIKVDHQTKNIYSHFSEELALVQFYKGERTRYEYLYKTGFINKLGKIVIEPKFDGINHLNEGFSEGLAEIEINRKCGYIDKLGRFVVSPQYRSCSSFKEGIAIVSDGKSYMLIDKTGKVLAILNPETYVEHIWPFSEGLAVTSYGYINKAGKVVVFFEYDRAFPFSEGLAAVVVGDKWGYIDKAGNIVIPPKFAMNETGPGHPDRPISELEISFSEGMAAVIINHKWGYIDRTGKLVIQPQFDEVSQFKGGLAQVKVGSKIGYINKTGKYVWTPTE